VLGAGFGISRVTDLYEALQQAKDDGWAYGTLDAKHCRHPTACRYGSARSRPAALHHQPNKIGTIVNAALTQFEHGQLTMKSRAHQVVDAKSHIVPGAGLEVVERLPPERE
jgi:hypothetical protein